MLLVKLLLREIRVLLLILASLASVINASSSLGQYGGAFLRAPVGATGLGLGGAQTASASYFCSWWNPALLREIRKRTLSIATGYRPLGRTEGVVGFEFPIPPRMAMGISLLYRGDPFLNDLVDKDEYPLEDASYTTLSVKTGLSYLVTRKIALGLNFSVFYQRLPSDFIGSAEKEGEIIYSSETTIGGFDFGMTYKLNKKYRLGLVIKNLLAENKWELKNSLDDLYEMYSDKLPATITLGHEFKTNLQGKPFIWTCDLIGYIFDCNLRVLDHVHAVVNNGFEWQKWEMFYIRAGVRDIVFNRDLFRDSRQYKDAFSLAGSLGCFIDLSKALRGRNIKFNYAVSTDKVGAGLDQQLDFIVSFK